MNPPGARAVDAGAAPAWLLLVSIVPAALNLRAGLTGIPPILPLLTRELPLTPVEASLLVALPTICFGVIAFAATPLRATLGDERAILLALIGLVTGLGMRALFPGALLFVGTVVACSGIGLLNVLLTSLIRRRAARGVGRLLAVNMLCLNLGSSLAAAVSVPIADATGSLLPTLGIWAVLAAIGIVLWLPQLWHRRDATIRRRDSLGAFHVARHPLSWALAAFMGLQSLSYYATLSWLPTLLQSRGMGAVAAGLLVAMLGIIGLVSATIGPLLTRGEVGQRIVVVVCFGLEAVGFAGFVLAPLVLAPLFAVLLAVGQGALLPLALLFLIVRAPDAATSAGLSAMGQGVGYLLASAGSFAVGQIYDASGTWLAPLGVFLVVVLAGIVCGLIGARDREVPSVATRALEDD